MQGRTKDFKYNKDCGSKWLKVYFQLNYTFFAIVPNFSAFCYAFEVHRQYTGLFQNSRIYAFLLNVMDKNIF